MSDDIKKDLSKYRQKKLIIVRDSYDEKEQVAKLLFFLAYNKNLDFDLYINFKDFKKFMYEHRRAGYDKIFKDSLHKISDIRGINYRYLHGVISSYVYENKDILNKFDKLARDYISNTLNVDLEIAYCVIEFDKFWKKRPSIT